MNRTKFPPVYHPSCTYEYTLESTDSDEEGKIEVQPDLNISQYVTNIWDYKDLLDLQIILFLI